MRESILSAIQSPDRAWLVILAGIIMIYREFMAPGRVLPGLFGGVAVCVGVYSLLQHPWSWWAAALIGTSIGLVIVQGIQRFFWLPCATAAILMTVGARRLTDPPISFLAAGISIPLCLVSGFLLRTALSARRRKRTV